MKVLNAQQLNAVIKLAANDFAAFGDVKLNDPFKYKFEAEVVPTTEDKLSDVNVTVVGASVSGSTSFFKAMGIFCIPQGVTVKEGKVKTLGIKAGTTTVLDNRTAKGLGIVPLSTYLQRTDAAGTKDPNNLEFSAKGFIGMIDRYSTESETKMKLLRTLTSYNDYSDFEAGTSTLDFSVEADRKEYTRLRNVLLQSGIKDEVRDDDSRIILYPVVTAIYK